MKRTTHYIFRFAISLAVCISGLSVSAQTLTHRYSFNDPAGSATFADSIGGPQWAGSLNGSANLDGTSLQLDGFGSWATLPPGILSNLTQVTIEFWATFNPDNPDWTRVFAFGDQENGAARTSLDYTHRAGGNWQNLGLRTTNANVWANNPGGLNGSTNIHITIVANPQNNQMYYYNGTTVASNPGVNGGNVPPLSGVNDQINLLGKSLYDVDATLAGSINEFRIYQGVLPLSAVALNEAAGPNNYLTNAGTLQSVTFSIPLNPILVNQSTQPAFTGNFANVAGVNLISYGGATFTSSNPGVVSINPTNGFIQALTQGTATVFARYGTLAASNTVTVSSSPAVLTHRYSFEANANDSVGRANGTLMGNATVAGGKAVLDGTAGTYVDLPGNVINIATNQSVTLEAWVTFGDLPDWTRLFDFGTEQASSELYFTPKGPGRGSRHWLSENFNGGRTIEWPPALTNVTVHITCVIDPPTGTLAMYRNGVLEYAVYDARAPLSLVATNLAVLGRSLVGADPFMPGAIDEFRIYSGALTAQEIALTEQNGPTSTNRNPGSLLSIRVQPTTYSANTYALVPAVYANYAGLTNFNLLLNSSSMAPGLVLTSGDTNIQVGANNLLRTFGPGTVTLTAAYLGQTNSATVTVGNTAVLTHRWSFNTNADDVVGNTNGILHGAATVSGGQLVLDGTGDTYFELPPGLLQGYDSVTVDTWVTFRDAATWARLWYFGDDRENEFYVAPSVVGDTVHWFSTGFPTGAQTISLSPGWHNETLHITAVYGSGSMELYTNGVLETSALTTGSLAQVGSWFSWIGRSPYADPFLNASIDEFRIYRGRLSAQQIAESQALGPDQLLVARPTLSISRASTNVVLNWPSSAGSFSLQTTTNLLSNQWPAVTNAPTQTGGNWQLSIPATANAQFFRLAK